MAVINKHFFVAPFNEETQELGTVETTVHGDLPAALLRAKTLAAANPDTYYVVYEAMWFAFTDITPVTVARVGSGAITV
jgi:hypothetical protein